MKILILKLGLMIFMLLFMLGAWRELALSTVIFRSFVAFLVIETCLVLMAVVFIKMTEKIRVEAEEAYDEAEAEEA